VIFFASGADVELLAVRVLLAGVRHCRTSGPPTVNKIFISIEGKCRPLRTNINPTGYHSHSLKHLLKILDVIHVIVCK
jgi:hypothetical protein